jgi:gliding motility-associated-like protein
MDVSKHHICIDEIFQIQNTSNQNYTKFGYQFYNGFKWQDSADQRLNWLDSVEQIGNPPNSVDHAFNKVGVYTIYGYPTGFGDSIPVASRKNCATVDTMLIEVHKPYPAFSIDTVDYPLYKFNNTSTSSYYYEWTIFNADGSQRDSKNGNINDPHWSYDLKNDTGTFKVCLRALTYDTLGHCPDSVCHSIYNNFVVDIKIPNAFSPNHDGHNEFFDIQIVGETKFELNVFNRWGDRVFESVDSKSQWNGTNLNDGSDCAAGVYYYVLTYKFRGRANTNTKTGTVTLIR